MKVDVETRIIECRVKLKQTSNKLIELRDQPGQVKELLQRKQELQEALEYYEEMVEENKVSNLAAEGDGEDGEIERDLGTAQQFKQETSDNLIPDLDQLE